MIPEAISLEVVVENYPLKEPFCITGHTQINAEVVTVRLMRNNVVGRGEASGVYYREDEDSSGLVSKIEAVRSTIERGISRKSLQDPCPP